MLGGANSHVEVGLRILGAFASLEHGDLTLLEVGGQIAFPFYEPNERIATREAVYVQQQREEEADVVGVLFKIEESPEGITKGLQTVIQKFAQLSHLARTMAELGPAKPIEEILALEA